MSHRTETTIQTTDRLDPVLPVLWQLELSHYNEKVRWALDYKRIPHIRRSLLPGPHIETAKRLTGDTSTTPVLTVDGHSIGDCYTAEMPDDFVVFLIGMRLNRPWKVHKWLPVFSAMPRMLRLLDQQPEVGLLKFHNAWINGPAVVQYWRSFTHLERFARASGLPHLASWKRFNQAVGASGEVGIWHETYKVRAGEYECVYVNMPPVALAAAGVHVPIGSTGQSSARRVGATEIDERAPRVAAMSLEAACRAQLAAAEGSSSGGSAFGPSG